MEDEVFHSEGRHHHISLQQQRCWRSCPKKTSSTSYSGGRKADLPVAFVITGKR